MSRAGMLALGLVAGAVAVLCGLAAGGLLIAAAVVALAPVTGTAPALALVAAGLVAVIGIVLVTTSMALRRSRARRRAAPAVPAIAVLEVALAVLPRRRVAQAEAALVAGVAVGTLLSGVMGKGREA